MPSSTSEVSRDRIGPDSGDVHALARALLADEAAHVLVADAGDEAAFETEPRRADGDVGRTAADRLGEARHILEAAADLHAVEIDRRTADRDDVEAGIRPSATPAQGSIGGSPAPTTFWSKSMFAPVMSPDSSEQRIGAGARHFLRIDEPPERPRLHRLLEPPVLGAVVGLHDAVLARGRHPADVEAVDADAELEQRVGDVPGQGGERALRGAIGGDEGLPAMARHRLDVDDRARDLLPPHDPHRLLDEKERRAHVDVEDLVVALLGGVENVAAVGQRGGVDERVDAAEALVRLGRPPCGSRPPSRDPP